MIKGPGASVKM